MARKTGPRAILARAIQAFSAAAGGPIIRALASSSASRGLRAAEADREAGQGRRRRVGRVGQDGRVVAQLLEPEAGDLAAAAAARREGGHQDREIADVDEFVGAAGGGEPIENVACNGALTLPRAGTPGGAYGEPKSRAEGRGGEWALEPSPRCRSPARQAPPRRRRTALAGMPLATPSASRLAGSQRWCATNLSGSASTPAGQGHGGGGDAHASR